MKPILTAILLTLIFASLAPSAEARDRRHRHRVVFVEGQPYYNVYYDDDPTTLLPASLL